MKIVIVNCFETYQIRVTALYDFFNCNGNEVIIIESNYSHNKKKYILESKKDYVQINVHAYKKNLSFDRLYSHYKFANDVFKIVKNFQPDILYVLIPPNSLVKEAAKYKSENKNVKLIFDVIDMWPETMPINYFKKSIPFKLWGDLRNNYISKADYIITECNLYQKVLAEYVQSKKMKTIYLSKTEQYLKSKSCVDDNVISMCYLGSINNIIDIDLIITVLKNVNETENKVVLKLIGDGERKNELLEKCKSSNIKVIDYGKIYSEEKKQAIFDTCHFGLNIYKKSTYIGLTMKSIDYFMAGLPVINNIEGDSELLIKKYKCGINLCKNNIEDVIEEIVHMSSDDNYNLRINAKKLFYEKFSVDAFEEKIDNLMDHL